MKRRGWRVALTVAMIGLALVASLVAFNWATVRDHAEAWWFVATTETLTIKPHPSLQGQAIDGRKLFDPLEPRDVRVTDCLKVLADYSGCPIIADVKASIWWFSPGNRIYKKVFTGTEAAAVLREANWRIVEQRFPYPAYVVLGYYPDGDTLFSYKKSSPVTYEYRR